MALLVRSAISKLSQIYCKWDKPPQGMFKFNVDGSKWRDPQEVAGTGGILRDYLGEFLLAFCSRMEPGHNHEIFEFAGFRDALRIMVEEQIKMSCVNMETDSDKVLQAILKMNLGQFVSGNTKDNYDMKSDIKNEIYNLKEGIINCRRVFRESNTCADYFANYCKNLEIGETRVFRHTSELDPEIRNLIDEDKNGILRPRQTKAKAPKAPKSPGVQPPNKASTKSS